MKYLSVLIGSLICFSVSASGQTASPVPPETPPIALPQDSRPEVLLPPPPPAEPLVLKPDPETGAYRLTVTQTVTRAWQANPEILAADSRVRQAYWALEEADSLPSSSVGLGSYQGNGQAFSNGNYISANRSDYYVWLLQPFRPLGSTGTGQRLAYHQLHQAQSEATLARIQLAQRSKDAYYKLMAAEQQLQVAQKNLELAEQVLNTTQLRFSKGSGPRLDEINATIQRNRSRQDVTLARGQWAQAQAQLAPLVGLAAENHLQTDGVLDPPPGQYLYDTLLELARQHPRLQVARDAQLQSNQARVLAEQQNNPTPNLMAVYDMVRPSYLVQLTLSIPIDWGVIGNDVRRKREIEVEKEQLLQREKLALSSDLRQAYASYQATYDNAISYNEEVLKPSEESTRITEYGYRRGALPYLQLLATQQQLSNIRKDYIERQLAVHLSLDALEAVVGRQLEGRESSAQTPEP